MTDPSSIPTPHALALPGQARDGNEKTSEGGRSGLWVRVAGRVRTWRKTQKLQAQAFGRLPAPPRTRTAGSTCLLRGDDAMIPILADRYVSLRHRPRPTFAYYIVHDVYCTYCGTRNRPDDGTQCTHCQQALPLYLLHVSRSLGNPHLAVNEILQLSQSHPLILKHISFWQEREWFIVMLEHPSGWRPIWELVPVADVGQVAAWGIQLGEALAFLHGRAVVHFALDTQSLEGIIIHEGQARLPDLTRCRALHLVADDARAHSLFQRDVMFLARAVHYMATGQLRPDAAESAFSGVFHRAFNNEYAGVEQLLDDLRAIHGGQQVRVRVSYSIGQATHPGMVRRLNEDRHFVLPVMQRLETRTLTTAFCLVADGMGGQDAGEQAAEIAYRTIAAEIHGQLIMPALQGEVTRKLFISSGEMLKEAVEKANQQILDFARRRGSNMGTTVTAALLEGPRAYVVNVGDSRTYRLRNGFLEQVTEDHSLVASLLRAGAISEQEMYLHPNRNQIYRSLGSKAHVEVDLYTIDLKKGDHLLLCSDGLWEMVRDQEIRDILQRAPSVQAACEQLVQAACSAGGEDNVTAIVVRVE